MTELVQRIAAFFDILSTRNVLIEIAVVAACLLAGWFAGAAARDRFQRRRIKAPTALTWSYFAPQAMVVSAPAIVALVLVVVARNVLSAAQFDVTILDAAAHLILAYVVVRIIVLLFTASLGNKSWMQHWESRATLGVWLIIAAEYLGWLDPIISTLDGIGVAAGRSRITVWSVLKLLFTLTIFVLVAAWISRWVERRLKKLENLAPSTRIGIGKFANAFLIGLSILLGLNAAGVDLTALTVLTGAIGLGLGFGLQSIAANFVSGFVLLMDRSIKPGDVISLSGQSGTSTENFGWVQELRGRYVVVRDRDGVEMLVPNQQLISNAVINWSYTDPLIRLKLPIRVTAITPLAENMISGDAFPTTSILTTRSGRTIEVRNTDAEGRLILADGLALAAERKPDYIVDAATLTGAACVALGADIAAVFGSDAKLTKNLLAASVSADEYFWEMPIFAPYSDLLKSPVADCTNIGGGRYGGAIMGALFLQPWVPEGTPWLHLDIAGPGGKEADMGHLGKGGKGFGVKTLVALAEKLA